MGGQVSGFDPHTAERMRAAGMTWVKQQLPHSAGIATGTTWISDAHAKGFKILLSVPGDKNGLVSERFDSYVADYAGFLGQLAAAGADAIEVWNEPNLDHEWPTGQISGATYTRLLAAAYNAIKAANGATLVISAAPAPTGAEGAYPGQVVNDDNFMRQMANAGAAQYMDCLGLHYNEGILSPNQNTGDPPRRLPHSLLRVNAGARRAILPRQEHLLDRAGILERRRVRHTDSRPFWLGAQRHSGAASRVAGASGGTFGAGSARVDADRVERQLSALGRRSTRRLRHHPARRQLSGLRYTGASDSRRLAIAHSLISQHQAPHVSGAFQFLMLRQLHGIHSSQLRTQRSSIRQSVSTC